MAVASAVFVCRVVHMIPYMLVSRFIPQLFTPPCLTEGLLDDRSSLKTSISGINRQISHIAGQVLKEDNRCWNGTEQK